MLFVIGIVKESILLNHKVTEVRWYGIDQSDKSDNVNSSADVSDNESNDSDKTVINIGENCEKNVTDSIFTNYVYENENENENGVEVQCENGIKFTADCVICTLPLGVLKENISKIFLPPLPEYKVESIERLLFGTVDKIFLYYDRPFLNSDVSEILLLWESDHDATSKTDNGELNTLFIQFYI